MREQAQTEKEEMERRMKELQDQCEQAHEALASSDQWSCLWYLTVK